MIIHTRKNKSSKETRKWAKKVRKAKSQIIKEGYSVPVFGDMYDPTYKKKKLPCVAKDDTAFVGSIRRKLLCKKNAGEGVAEARLRSLMLHYDREWGFRYCGKLFFVDFVVQLQNGRIIALEIDGSIHLRKDIIDKDLVKDGAMIGLGLFDAVVRIPVGPIFRMTAQELLEVLSLSEPGVITRYSGPAH